MKITVTPLMTKKYQTSLKKHFGIKANSFNYSHKEAIERKVDTLLAGKPENCVEQVTLKKVPNRS